MSRATFESRLVSWENRKFKEYSDSIDESEAFFESLSEEEYEEYESLSYAEQDKWFRKWKASFSEY